MHQNTTTFISFPIVYSVCIPSCVFTYHAPYISQTVVLYTSPGAPAITITVGAESSIIASNNSNFPCLSLALFTHYVFLCVSSGSSSLSVCSCGPFSSWNYVWLVRKNHCHGITVSCTNRPFYLHGGHIEIIRFKSIMGCPGGTRSVFTRASRAKRELHYVFLGKKSIIITSNTAQRSFFFPITTFF